jgi:hypothetical protein
MEELEEYEKGEELLLDGTKKLVIVSLAITSPPRA